MENNEKKGNGLLIGLVVFLLIAVLSLGGYIVYDKVIDKDEPKTEETKNDSEETNDNIESKQMTKEEISKLFTDYYDEIIKNDLLNHDPKSQKYSNTEKYDVISISYDLDLERYNVKYIYACKDGNADCLAVSQSTSDKSPATADLCFKVVDGKITSPGSCVTTGPRMLSVEKYNEYYN